MSTVEARDRIVDVFESSAEMPGNDAAFLLALDAYRDATIAEAVKMLRGYAEDAVHDSGRWRNVTGRYYINGAADRLKNEWGIE